MTIIRDVENTFDEIIKIINQVKDHAQWEIDEEYYAKQEAKQNEYEKNMNEIENKLEKLTKTELLCFRHLLMDDYPIYSMGYDIGTIMHTIDGVGATFDEINKLLEIVKDHTKWQIPESVYIKDIENGVYDED